MTVQMEAGPRARFCQRDRCILCGSSDLLVLWNGAFTDEIVQAETRKSGYAHNPLALLQEASFRRVRCQKCEMSFYQDILTDDWLKVLYEKWICDEQIEALEAAKRFSKADMGTHYAKHCLRLRQMMGAHKTASPRLLDFGCGDGHFLQVASSFGFESVGIDFSDSRQNRVYPSNNISLYANLGQLCQSPAGQTPFDAITLFQVLEHLSNPLEVLRSLYDWLSPTGFLIVEVPDCQGVAGIPTNSEDYSKVNPLEHINHFTPDTLTRMCQRAGFQSVPHPVAIVTTDWKNVLKGFAGGVLRKSMFGTLQRTTQQYFCKA
jgi:2-polyprenyl-3-methyl-5-hydroxy-6-metoxy-1,4-benzoquinol methylase